MSSNNGTVPSSKQHKLNATACAIAKVTVYTDRAEIKRNIELKLKQGLNEVHVENVPRMVITDSIRVDGRGNATIHEVQFKEEHLPENEVKSLKIDTLQDELDEIKSRKNALEDKDAIISKQVESLGELIKNFGKCVTMNGNQSAVMQFDSSAEHSLQTLYDFHERKAMGLADRVRSTKKELEQLKKQIAQKNHELNKLKEKARLKKTIIITVKNNGKDEEPVELILTYQVNHARWSPMYDVRIDLEPGKEAQQQHIQLTYYGKIEQESGEEWKDVHLVLTTAQPDAGTLPRLGTTTAQFVRPELAAKSRASYSMFMGAPTAMAKRKSASYRNRLVEEDDEQLEYEEERSAIAWEATAAEEQVLSTNFDIKQQKTIPDDGSEHKVTIALLELDTAPVRFECVPSKNINVFMSATITNTSKFPLLKGKASIFVNNCFMQRIHIDSVSTGDNFTIPLGICPSIKVTYKPAHKYHQQIGMLLSKSSSMVHEQKIHVTNFKQEAVLLTIFEPIPKPTDEKIKIRLLSPDVKAHKQEQADDTGGRKNSATIPKLEASTADQSKQQQPIEGARVNADNNLEWVIKINRDKELVVKWEAEYPHNEKIEMKETH